MSRVIAPVLRNGFPFGIPNWTKWDLSTYTTPDFTSPQTQEPGIDYRVYAYPADANGTTNVVGPGTDISIAVDFKDAVMIYWRARQFLFDIDFTVPGGPGRDASYSYTGGPQQAIPGNVLHWSDGVGWDGDGALNSADERSLVPGAPALISLTLDFIPNYYFQQSIELRPQDFAYDEDGQLWWRGVSFVGDSDFNTIPELTGSKVKLYQCRNSDALGRATPPAAADYTECDPMDASFTLTILGFTKALYCTDASAAPSYDGGSAGPGDGSGVPTGSLEVTVKKYWPYEDAGGAALFDEDSGDYIG